MSELNRGISLVIMILSIILLMIIGLFVYWEFFSANSKKENVNFFKEGNLIINNPGFATNVWYLSYEVQGSSANSIKLLFDKNSICENENNSCLEITSGERVEVRGVIDNNEVLVKELKKVYLTN